MTFAENINRLCQAKGTKLTPFLRSLGFSGSKATAINKGQIPNNEEDLLKIAAGLQCSVLDLFADFEDFTPGAYPKDEDEQDILRVYRSLSRRAKHEFMSMVYDFENREELEGDKDNTAAV